MAKKGIKILKFGGTSVGTPEAIRRVVSIIRRPSRDARSAAVVVSAMGGATDELITIAKLAAQKDDSYELRLQKLAKRHLDVVEKLVSVRARPKAKAEIERMVGYLSEAVKGILHVGGLSPQAQDYIMSYGERLSAHLLTAVLNDRGVACEYLNARHIIKTDENFGGASINIPATKRIVRAYFKAHKKLQIVTGFIGSTREKKTTTLGRGGSDYSAAIIGASLGAHSIEIWTDVSGVYTADPRLEKSARVVPELTFEEAGELAYFGAKVLHPKTILPAMREKIPVRVLNTFKPTAKGTTIVSDAGERLKRSSTVEALTFKRSVTIIHIQSPEFFDANGLMARIFDIFETHRTSIDVIATSIAGVSLTVDNDERLPEITRALKKYGSVTIERGKAIVCAVGGRVNAAGVAGRMFTVLGKHGIAVEMISQAASGVSITFVVNEKDAEKTLKVLHRTYIRG